MNAELPRSSGWHPMGGGCTASLAPRPSKLGCTICEYETETSWDECAVMGCLEERSFKIPTAKITSPTSLVTCLLHSTWIAQHMQPDATSVEIFNTFSTLGLLLVGWHLPVYWAMLFSFLENLTLMPVLYRRRCIFMSSEATEQTN